MRILAYHGVLTRDIPGDPLVPLFTPVEGFAEQMAWLARRAQPVTLSDVADHVRTGAPLPPRAVHVSFDDGYRNTLAAAEILDHYEIPWSLFAVVDAVLDGYRPWFVRLADTLSQTDRVRLADGTDVAVRSVADKRRFARLAKTEIMAAPARRADAVADGILRLPGMARPEGTNWPFLTLEELRELHAAGVEIGNHTARHRNLNRCGAGELDDEIHGARRRLSAALGAPVRYFAYPDGRHNAAARRSVARGHDLGLAVWTFRRHRGATAVRRYEPGPSIDDLAQLISREPVIRAGAQWVRWHARQRVRERVIRMAPGRWSVVRASV